jgi:hypothetical protein
MRCPRLASAAVLCILALLLPASALAATRVGKAAARQSVQQCKPTTAARKATLRKATVRKATVRKATVRKAGVRAKAARATASRRTTAAKRAAAKRVAAKAAAARCVVGTNRVVRRTTTTQAPKAPAAAPAAAPAPAPAAALPIRLAAKPAAAQPAKPAPAPAAAPCCSTPAPSAPAAATTPVPAADGMLYGIHASAHWTAAWGDPGPYLDKVLATGTTALREDFKMDLIERTEGSWDWKRYDALYAATAVRGMTILPVLDDAPGWADGATYPKVAEYAAFTAASVKRYGPNGTFWAAHPELPATGASTYWELFNEPYEAFFAKGNPDPAAYARLAVAAADAGRAADPDARFLLEATPKSYGGRTWVDGMYAAVPDLNAHFDGVAVHAYGVNTADGNGQFRRTMEETRASFVAHGASDKPFWVTETGTSTCEGTDISCVSETRQAAHLTEVLTAMKTTYASYVRSVFVYHFRDPDKAVLSPTNSEDHFGISYKDGRPKPAMVALQKFLGV